jgi:hypothetical protein
MRDKFAVTFSRRRNRLVEASSTCLATGIIIGCVASNLGETAYNVAFGFSFGWLLVQSWRIVRSHNTEKGAV